MAKRNNEYRMAIKIAGEMEKSLYNCTDLTRKELNKIAKEAAYASSKTKGVFRDGLEETTPLFQGMEKVGVGAFKAVAAAAAGAGAAVMGIGTAAGGAGIEFESAFAGVKKTTDATALEYAQIRKEILAMTREIPAAGDGISEVAEAAGQLGIAKEDLLSFSRVMIDLRESTNLTSEESASNLAKFANITNMDPGNYSRLGSTIVDLGNNFATTEADIVSMATRMASAGDLAGFTEAQIMAMATAMSSVGIEDEAGGSAMSKIIKNVQVAVETGNKSLKSYADVAGMSIEEFKSAFEKDGLTAVAAFINGLNDVERNGKSATVILDEMGLTEARMSNVLTSLANADNLMLDAVETANKAWEENIALTKEAGMRYETTESKINIMKNGFTEMGIEIYDQFNGPLREGIDIVTQLVHKATDDIKGNNAIHDLAEDIVDGLPAAIRIAEEMAGVVGDLAGHVFALGGWAADHPELLVSVFAGTGTAVGLHKAARGVNAVATALKALGPAAVPVLGAAAGITALVSAGTYLYQMDKELTQTNIAEHFGDISLSMEGIDNAARHIVGSGNLDKIDELLSASANSDSLMRSVESAMREVQEKKWELGVGLEFSEEDMESYAADVQKYMEEAQEYIKSEGYTLHLSAELLLSGVDGAESIIGDNDEFYRQLEAHMGLLRDKTSRMISDALENGLEIDQEEIDKVLQDMQTLTDAISNAQMDAKMDRIREEFSGADLDKESFEGLMQKVTEYQGEMDAAALDAYEKSIANLNTKKALGLVTEKEYNAEKTNLQKGLELRRGEGMANVQSFLYDSILDAYQEELGSSDLLQRKINTIISQKMGEIRDNGGDFTLARAAKELAYTEEFLSKRDKKGMDVLWGDMEEQYAVMEAAWQEYMADGKEVPVEMKEAMKKASTIGMLAGDENAAENLFALAADGSKEYQDIINQVHEKGYEIPEAMSAAAGIEIIPENQEETLAKELVKSHNLVEQKVNEEFADGIDVVVDLNYAFNGNMFWKKKGNVSLISSFGKKDIEENADGGIITSPTISWLAEGGYPESVIPLDGSANAVALWKKTGEMLGVSNGKSRFSKLADEITGEPGSKSGNGAVATWDESSESNSFVFSPNINISSGNTNEQEIKKVIREMYGEFAELVNKEIDRRKRNKERFNFY